jgi:S-adenosylmethionine decarboxylase
MQGLHLTADLHGCPADRPLMTDTDALRSLCLAAIDAAGLQPVGELFHRFAPVAGGSAGAPVGIAHEGMDTPVGSTGESMHTPVGITGVVLLAESHLAVHTWPEIASVTLDVYVCNLGADNSTRAHTLMAGLVAAFEPARVERHALRRGLPGGPA